MSGSSEFGAERNDADWVRESVIEELRESDSEIVGSGAWLARESEDGSIQLYKHTEEITMNDTNGDTETCAYCGDEITDGATITPGTDKKFCSTQCSLDYANSSLEVVDGENGPEYVEHE